MTTELDKLLSLLPKVFTDSPERRELKILKTGEVACAFRIPLRELRSAWTAAVALHPKTGMWPVAVTCRDPAGIAAEDIFSRNYFREEAARADHSPRAILERSRPVDVDKFLAKLALKAAANYDIQDCIENEIDAMRFALNKAPKRPEIDAAIRSKKIRDPYAFDRWLLDWELANKVKRDPKEGRHEPVAREPVYLVFVPVANSWDALAYIHWYGCIHYDTEAMIALGHAWQKRYGAEVLAIYGTTLECVVARPPQTLEAAWSLARDHDLVAPSANAASGTPVRQYALSLVNHRHWSFHERP